MKPPNICATHQAKVSYMMDVQKRYEDTNKSQNNSRGMSIFFWKIYNHKQFIGDREKNNSNNTK